MNMPLFPSSKSVNRFEMTSRYPYLSDNEVTPTRYSSGYKLHEIGDTDKVLNNSFKELHNPDQNLGIDEQIIGKARISFLQHMLLRCHLVQLVPDDLYIENRSNIASTHPLHTS